MTSLQLPFSQSAPKNSTRAHCNIKKSPGRWDDWRVVIICGLVGICEKMKWKQRLCCQCKRMAITLRVNLMAIRVISYLFPSVCSVTEHHMQLVIVSYWAHFVNTPHILPGLGRHLQSPSDWDVLFKQICTVQWLPQGGWGIPANFII